MDAVARELFGTPMGLLSLGTILFLCAMGLFITWQAFRNMKDEAR